MDLLAGCATRSKSKEYRGGAMKAKLSNTLTCGGQAMSWSCQFRSQQKKGKSGVLSSPRDSPANNRPRTGGRLRLPGRHPNPITSTRGVRKLLSRLRCRAPINSEYFPGKCYQELSCPNVMRVDVRN